MAWSHSTASLMNEVALQSAEEFLGIVKARLGRDTRYFREFRAATIDILFELWPPGTEVDALSYLLAVDGDIDRMPMDLLEDLSASLTDMARTQRKDNTSGSSAAQLAANWLKMRMVELRTENDSATTARLLKNDYTKFFKRVLGNGTVGGPERVHEPTAGAGHV